MQNQKPPGSPGQPGKANIPLNQTEVVPCGECGHGRMIPVLELRRLPGLSPQAPLPGKDHYFFKQISMECQSCEREWTLDEMVKARMKKGPVLVNDSKTEKEG